MSAEADKTEEEYTKKVIPKSQEAIDRITLAMRDSILFQTLSEEQTKDIIDSMIEVKVRAGDDVCRQYDDGDFYYIIDSGNFEVLIKDGSKLSPGGPTHRHTYEGKGSFGELALMYNCPRTATIRAATEGVVFATDRQTFRQIVTKSQAKQRQLYEAFISKVPLFGNLSPAERASIADYLVAQTFEDGACPIREGEQADKFYIIEKGAAKATQTVDGTETVINTLGVGDYFGERALITNTARSATVVAVGQLVVAAMDRSAFERVLGPARSIMERQISEYKS